MLHYETIVVTAFAQNCSIVWEDETKQAALIDPGGDMEQILAHAEKLGVQISQIWLTHAHIDHAGAVAGLSTLLSIPIIGPHEGDLFWIQGLPAQSKMFGLPHAEAFTPTRWLHDGDSVALGNYSLQVLHCPGHTPGHVVFYSNDLQRVFVGDVLFVGSIGRTDFPQGDHGQLIDSIQNKLFKLGDAVGFIPGHGPEGTLGHERLHNPYVRVLG